MDQDAPPELSQIIPGFTSITGPLLLGVILNWALFGVLSTQVYIYYQAFRKDKVLLRILIYTVYALELGQTILLVQTVWHTYAAEFGNINVFDEVGTTWLSVGIIGGLVAFMVQSFYAYRILVLSQNKIIAGIIMLMAVSSYAGSVATSISLAQTKIFSRFLEEGRKQRIFGLFGLWQSAGTVSDVLIALCMIYYLRKLSQGGLLPTQRVVDRLLRLTVETGTVTATLSILSVAVYYAFTQYQYYQVPLAAMGKIYSNTMLVAVNSRMRFKVISESTTWKDVAVVSLHFESSAEESATALPRSDMTQRTAGPLESIVFEPRDNSSMDDQRRKTQEIEAAVV